MSRNPDAQEKLDAHGLENVIDDILDGKSKVQICTSLGISNSAMTRWLAADSSRSARVREAVIQSAELEDDKALEVLEDKTIDPARAREIASHRRWRARIRNPREYGDKLAIDQTNRVVNLSPEELQAELDRIRAARQAAIPAPGAAPADPWALPSTPEPRLDE